VTYLLHPDGGDLSFIFYHGGTATPTHCTNGTAIGALDGTGTVCGVTAAGIVGNTDFDFTAATGFRNTFNRSAFYGSYPIGKFLPMAGFQYGSDATPVTPATFPTTPTITTFTSKGAYVDGTFPINENATVGLRYDWLHPNIAKLNTQWAIMPYVNIPLNNGIQFIAEYQHRDFQLDATHHRQNDTFQVRFIFIQ
jgi:hypothetical protein